jgi:hypothetical protein
MDLESAERRLKTFMGEMTFVEGLRVKRWRELKDCRAVGSWQARPSYGHPIVRFWLAGHSRHSCQLDYVPFAQERKWRVIRGAVWKQSYKLLDSALDTIAQYMRE